MDRYMIDVIIDQYRFSPAFHTPSARRTSHATQSISENDRIDLGDRSKS